MYDATDGACGSVGACCAKDDISDACAEHDVANDVFGLQVQLTPLTAPLPQVLRVVPQLEPVARQEHVAPLAAL